jgi:hypothetical protein
MDRSLGFGHLQLRWAFLEKLGIEKLGISAPVKDATPDPIDAELTPCGDNPRRVRILFFN